MGRNHRRKSPAKRVHRGCVRRRRNGQRIDHLVDRDELCFHEVVFQARFADLFFPKITRRARGIAVCNALLQPPDVTAARFNK